MGADLSAAGKAISRSYLGLILLFVLGPAAVVAVDSFNSATSFPSPFEGFTPRWYRALADHPEFLSGFWSSLIVATTASAVATSFALLAAHGLVRLRPRARHAAVTLMSGPLLVPEIVVGLAVLQLCSLAGVRLSLAALVGTHAVFVLPLAVRLILNALSGIDGSLQEAAEILGASRWQTICWVVLPLLRPSLSAAFVLSAVLSFVNLPLSMFLTGARTATLPVVMFAYIESRIDPVAAAVATLTMLAAALVVMAVDRVLKIRVLG